MATTTYSFSDIKMAISHPNVGQYVISGEGVGSINISMSNDRTMHDIAADGSVMVSKIRARNGLLALTVQQTSAINKWLLKWYNYLEFADASEWADTTVIIYGMGETYTALGVSPQKLPDRPYQAQGQNIVWNLMSADITQ